MLVCGGDGTVAACAGALAGTGVAMALVPFGTGNLLARNLGIPLEMAEALDVAFGPDERTLDVLEAGEQRFVVMAGLGFDAALMRDTDEDLKDRIGWLAYVGGMAKALRRTPRARFTMTIDDGPPETSQAIGVLVGNVGQLQAGITLMPDARPDDGQLDVLVLAPRTVAGLAGAGLADPAPPSGLRPAGRHPARQGWCRSPPRSRCRWSSTATSAVRPPSSGSRCCRPRWSLRCGRP